MTMGRGLIASTAGNQLFAVVANRLYSVSSGGVRTQIGALITSTGPVGMKIGLTQLVVTDGSFGYVYDLQAHTFTRILSDAWLGSATVEYLGGYFSFIDPNSQTFYISAQEDATTIDGLDFATANDAPDKLVGQISTSNVIVYFGEVSGEVWQLDPSGGDFALQRNSGAYIEVGLLAAFTAKELDNTVYWLGRDERGAGMVYKLEGFRAQRISNMAVEQKIQEAISAGNDMSKAVAYTYQQGGHSFYVLQVPGLDTTWVYDASSQQWHERAELVLGRYAQHRGNYHAYCFGKHLIMGENDIIYAYDVDANTNAGDVLVRDRISPHYASPALSRVFFERFELDCVVGYGIAGDAQASAMLRYSNDGGFNWGSWRTATIGAVGEKSARARFMRCGSGYDRIWHVRVTDDVPFAIVNAVVQAVPGDN